jgi:hypothetical protein
MFNLLKLKKNNTLITGYDMTVPNDKCDILNKIQKQQDGEKIITGYEWYFITFLMFNISLNISCVREGSHI